MFIIVLKLMVDIMIINESDVKINLIYDGNLHSNLKLSEVEEFLSVHKQSHTDMKAREMIRIDDTSMYFSQDKDKNIFYPYVYKTSMGSDKWIVFMKDDVEGYALYENPQTERMQLAWYHRKLDKPLTQDEEEKLITCYVPVK